MASSTRFSKIGNWFGAADRPPDQVLQSDDATTITSSASHLDFSPPDGVMLGLDGMGRLDGESTGNIASGADGAIEGNAAASASADVTVTGPAVDQGPASVEAGSTDHILVDQGNVNTNNQGDFNAPGKQLDPGQVNVAGGTFPLPSGIAGAGSITMPHTADVAASFAGHGQTAQVPQSGGTATITSRTALGDNSANVTAVLPPPTPTHGFVYDGTSFTTLDPPESASTFAHSINATGEVAGGYQDSTGFHGFLYDGSSYTTLDPPGSTYTAPESINATGEVAGQHQDSAGHQHGFLYDGKSYTTLDPPSSTYTEAQSINATGEVAGRYQDSAGQHGFVYDGTSYSTLDPPGGIFTNAHSINATGEVAGEYFSAGQEHGFVYDGSSYTTLDVPGNTFTVANSINATGEVAGEYRDSAGRQHGFVYDGKSYTTLDPPGSLATIADSINATGEVAGFYEDSTGERHGFLYDGSSYTTLDPPGSTDSIAYSINDAGEVAGAYTIVPCYCRGTMILTEPGEVAVEDLAIGDRVITASGMARPIKWIGRRGYSRRFALGQTHILPICIRAGALADGVPRRELWISPHHAMYLEGVLIEVRDLVNLVSIFQAERVDQIEYFHIELDSHDVIIAEGAPSESYVDDDNRGMFHNAHEYRALYPKEVRRWPQYCAPRPAEGYEVQQARQTIARRAGLPSTVENPRVGALRSYIDEVGPGLIKGMGAACRPSRGAGVPRHRCGPRADRPGGGEPLPRRSGGCRARQREAWLCVCSAGRVGVCPSGGRGASLARRRRAASFEGTGATAVQQRTKRSSRRGEPDPG